MTSNYSSVIKTKNNRDGFLVKSSLFEKKKNWRHLPDAASLLAWLRETGSQVLYVRHPRWIIMDFDGAIGDQPAVLKAARAVLARAGFKEGEDFIIVLSGGKGIRVTWRYLLPSPEDATLIINRIHRAAKETWVSAPRCPVKVKEALKKLEEKKKKREELLQAIAVAKSQKDHGGLRKLFQKLRLISREISRLKEAASAWRPRQRKVRADVFLDKNFSFRSQPERILGWDEKGRKWARPLQVGREIYSRTEYRKLTRPPRDKGRALLLYVQEILPREEIPARAKKILSEERYRKELEKENDSLLREFSFLFSLQGKGNEKVLSRLQEILCETKEESGQDDILAAFLANYPHRIRHKGKVIGLVGPCPGCGHRDKAYLTEKNGRWWIRCHRPSCNLHTGETLASFLGVSSSSSSSYGKKKEILHRPGLGNFLSPEWKNPRPEEDSQEILSLLEKEQAVLVSWPLGAGKTTFSALIAANKGKRVWILCKRRKDIEEIVTQIKEYNKEAKVIILPKKEESTCPHYRKIKLLRELCLSDLHICSRCKEHNSCEIIRKLTTAPRGAVVVGTHNHLIFALNNQPDLILIDESHNLIQKNEIEWSKFCDLLSYSLGYDFYREAEEVRKKMTLSPALMQKEILFTDLDTVKKKVANILSELLKEHDNKIHKLRKKIENPNEYKQSDVWCFLQAMVAISKGIAKLHFYKENNKTKKKIIFYLPEHYMADRLGDTKVVFFSATCPPKILSRVTGLDIKYIGYVRPRKGRMVGIIPVSSTGKFNMVYKRKGVKIIQNVRKILKNNTEAIITYKEIAEEVMKEYEIEKDKVVSWGRHEATNSLQDVKSLAIEGNLIPSPSEIAKYLALCDSKEEQAEMLFFLTVAQLIQAIGRCRQLWEEEDAVVYLINSHLLQYQRFLLPYLGPFDLLFYITDKRVDTKRKEIALKTALKADNIEETFLNTYSSLTSSRQARHSWAKRFSRLQYFHQKWRAWWEYIQKQAGDGEKVPYPRLVEIFSRKINEFLPRIFPRRGPPRQLSFSYLGGITYA